MYEQEAYCNILVKYREELTRPIDEAMEFLKRVEAQLDSISGGSTARLSLAGKGSCTFVVLLLASSSSRTWSYGVPEYFLLPYISSHLTPLGNGCSG